MGGLIGVFLKFWGGFGFRWLWIIVFRIGLVKIIWIEYYKVERLNLSLREFIVFRFYFVLGLMEIVLDLRNK